MPVRTGRTGNPWTPSVGMHTGTSHCATQYGGSHSLEMDQRTKQCHAKEKSKRSVRQTKNTLKEGCRVIGEKGPKGLTEGDSAEDRIKTRELVPHKSGCPVS